MRSYNGRQNVGNLPRLRILMLPGLMFDMDFSASPKKRDIRGRAPYVLGPPWQTIIPGPWRTLRALSTQNARRSGADAISPRTSVRQRHSAGADGRVQSIKTGVERYRYILLNYCTRRELCGVI